MKLKYVTNIAVLLSVLGSACVNAKEWTSIRIATEGAYEPWNLTLPGGKLGGFEPELMADLCHRMEIDCQLKVQNWDGMMAGLNAGKYDMIMDAISITAERKKIISFSVPYAATAASFVIKNKSLLAPSVDSVTKVKPDSKEVELVVAPLQKALNGKTIGIQSGTVYTSFIEKYFSNSTVREYTSASSAILDLRSGRIDAVFDDTTFTQAFLDKKENAKLAFGGPRIGGEIWGEGEGFGFRKSDTDLKNKVDAALKAAIADGTVKRLSQKWFHTDLTP